MLFDLRGRGRRGTVRVIYIGLALLIGVGLVGFGIGGGFGGGGLLSAATNAEGGGGNATRAKQIAKYRKLIKEQPRNTSDWENLTRNLMLEAGGEGYVTSSGLTSKGHTIFAEVAQAWSGYIALNPPKPSLELTKDMERIFGEEGLNEASQEVQLLQIVVAAEPNSAANYGTLAEYAYKAHDNSLGDLASGKAVALAPAADRKSVKNQLAEVKKNVEKAAKEATSSTAASTPSVTPEG